MQVRRFLAGLAAAAALCGGAFYFVTAPHVAVTGPLPPRTPDLANGQDMLNIGGCASCHATKGQDDRQRLGGGRELITDFGTFVAPNISPDPQNGLGGWTEEQFVNAMLRGVGRNGEHLYPAFPYGSYQRMRLDDVRDLYAHLKTLPADPSPSPPHRLAFPFTIRRGIGLWKLANLDGRSFAPDPAKSDAVNRGAYLVEGPGHCAECHSPRNVFGGIPEDRRFAGGRDPTGKGWVPNITPHADGIAAWQEGDLAYLLQIGLKPDMNSVGGSMADVVLNTAPLNPADQEAMAAYLKTLPPRPGKAPPRPQQ